MISGIHHVTAMCGDPQKNIDFYTQVLGLRLVKITVNFDDPSMYHLYYGDETGSPGTALTFFPIPGFGTSGLGPGQISRLYFSVPHQSLGFWKERLREASIEFEERSVFGHNCLLFQDHDGVRLALTESHDDRKPWVSGGVGESEAIRGFFMIELASYRAAQSTQFLESIFDYQYITEEGGLILLGAPSRRPGDFVAVIKDGNDIASKPGSMTYHHVAFETANQTTIQQALRRISENGRKVTEVQERCYFQSIYFREPGGVLFEIATVGPGFLIDEDVETLGQALKLPPWFENYRTQIENSLPKIRIGDGSQLP